MFKKAVKGARKFRIALDGPTGSGKTYTALAVGCNLGKRVVLLDTERGSASLYADKFEFDTAELSTHSPKTYTDTIKAAVAANYDVIIIDSLSHAWMGKDGALEQVDKAAKRSQSGNTFTAWRDVTPQHNELVDTIISANAHIICTMRAKMEYILESVTRNGKTTQQPKKVGMAPIQRDGVEYEFDIVADLDIDHNLMISKTRLDNLDGLVLHKAGKDFVELLNQWLSTTTVAAELPNKVEAPVVISETKPEPEEASGEQVVEPAAAAPADDNSNHLIKAEDWARLLVKAQAQGWNSLDLQRLSAKTFNMPVEDAEIITMQQAKRLSAIVSRLTPEKAGIR